MKQPEVADADSEVLRDSLWKRREPCRRVYFIASLPLSIPVELEVNFEARG